jgi:hypothetical protein
MLSLASAIVAGAMRLIDLRTDDGSRQFACLPQNAPWDAVRDHALRLPDAQIVSFASEEIGLPWLDFSFRGHRFLVHGRHGQLHFFVRQPHCSDLILFQVAQHFTELQSKHDREHHGENEEV